MTSYSAALLPPPPPPAVSPAIQSPRLHHPHHQHHPNLNHHSSITSLHQHRHHPSHAHTHLTHTSSQHHAHAHSPVITSQSGGGSSMAGVFKYGRSRSNLDNIPLERTIRIGLLGLSGCGKSAFAVRVLTNRFISDYSSCITDKYSKIEMFDNQPYKIVLFDTNFEDDDLGLESIKDWAHIFLVFFSVTSISSFYRAQELLRFLLSEKAKTTKTPTAATLKADKDKKSAALPCVPTPNSVFLVSNKSDLNDYRLVDEKDAQSRANEFAVQLLSCSSCTQPDAPSNLLSKIICIYLNSMKKSPSSRHQPANLLAIPSSSTTSATTSSSSSSFSNAGATNSAASQSKASHQPIKKRFIARIISPTIVCAPPQIAQISSCVDPSSMPLNSNGGGNVSNADAANSSTRAACVTDSAATTNEHHSVTNSFRKPNSYFKLFKKSKL